MASFAMRPGMYYECRSSRSLWIEDLDKESISGVRRVERGDFVLCDALVRRKRVRFARLILGSEALYLRVSENDIPGGDWEEVNPMIVLSMADQLPS